MATSQVLGSPLIGRNVGNFKIERLLGAGGMGEVYLLRHVQLPNTFAALKVMRATSVDLPSIKQRFVQEALVAAAVGSERVARPVDLGRFDDGAPYIVFEYAPGRTLTRELSERGPIDEAVALRIAYKIADTMSVVHARGIVHRDLKPSNLMLDGDDDPQVKVLDFGVARAPVDLRIAETVEHAIVGSPGFMSPEAATGSGIDERTDVFSLGATLFYCITGSTPFPGSLEGVGALLNEPAPRISTRRPNALAPVSEDVEELVARMLARSPAARPSMLEVRSSLAKLLKLTIPPGTPPVIKVAPVPLSADDIVASTLTAASGPVVDLDRIRSKLEQFCDAKLPTAQVTNQQRHSVMRWVVGMAATTIAIVVGVWWLRLGSAEPAIDPCLEDALRIDTLWSPDTRERVRVALAPDPDAAQDLAWFDRFAARWKQARLSRCDAGPDESHVRCLDHALEGFDAAVTMPWRTERKRARRWPVLPSIMRCEGADPDRVATTQLLPLRVRREGGRALSPDGTRIASAESGRVHIVDLAGKEFASVPVPVGSSVVGWPSPDRILVGSEPETWWLLRNAEGFGYRIELAVSPDTGQVSRTPIPKNVIALSPDRTRALVTDAGDLFVTAWPEGSTRIRLGTLGCSLEDFETAAWAPGGHRAVLTCTIRSANSQTRLRIVDLDAQTIRDVDLRDFGTPLVRWLSDDQLVYSAWGGRSGLGFGSGGLGLAILRLDVDGFPLEVPETRVEAEGNHQMIVHDVRADRLLAEEVIVTPDVVQFGDRTITALPPIPATQVLGVSGEWLLARGIGTGLFSLRDAAYRQLIAPDPAGDASGSKYSDGAESLAVAGDHLLAASRTGLVRITLSGERTTAATLPQVAPEFANGNTQLRCSPDGRRCLLAWQLPGKMMYLPIVDEKPASIQRLDRDFPRPIAIANDGRLAIPGGMAPDGRGPSIEIYDPATARSEVIPFPADSRCNLNSQHVSWSSTALFVAQLCHEGQSRLLRVGSDRKVEVLLDSDRYIGSLVARPDGTLFLQRSLMSANTVLVKNL